MCVCKGGSRRIHYMSSLKQNDRDSLDALQVQVGLGPTLHIPADVVIGKFCPPLDAKDIRGVIDRMCPKIGLDIESLSLRTWLAGHCCHWG